mgnify:CR=1 FL=1
MSEILNAFNNSWPIVQITMLVTLVALVTLPVWLTHRWLTLRKKMPDDILLALACNGDRVTLTVTKGAPITPNQLTGLLANPINGPEPDGPISSSP